MEHDRVKLERHIVRVEGNDFNSAGSFRKETIYRRGDFERRQGEDHEASSLTDMLEEEVRTRGQTTTKHLITNNSFKSRVKSIVDILEISGGSNRYFGEGHGRRQ